MMEWGDGLIVPAQWLTNLMAITPGKKGHRIVAVRASGYRAYASLEVDEDRRWNVIVLHADDPSTPTTSCMRATAEGLIEQDMLTAEGYRTLIILWGFVNLTIPSSMMSCRATARATTMARGRPQ